MKYSTVNILKLKKEDDTNATKRKKLNDRKIRFLFHASVIKSAFKCS